MRHHAGSLRRAVVGYQTSQFDSGLTQRAMSCEKASTSSSCAPVGNTQSWCRKSFTHARSGRARPCGCGCGNQTFPASTIGNAAWARAYFPPSGLTGMMPAIWPVRTLIIAGPFAASSIRVVCVSGYRPWRLDDLPTRLREVPLSFHAVDQVDVRALARGLQTDDVVVGGAAFE